MKALNLLKDEHSAILSELCMMDKQLMFLESSGQKKGARVLMGLVETSRRMHEKLQRHTNKEEIGLFPVLKGRLGGDREILEVMRHQHQEILESLNSLTAELEKMTRDHDTKRTWNLVSRFQHLKGGLSDHLSKEESVLFWLAELRLSKLDQRRIDSVFQGVPAGPQRLQG